MELKKLWQEFEVLPWLRYRVPILEGEKNGEKMIFFVPRVGAHAKVLPNPDQQGVNPVFSTF